MDSHASSLSRYQLRVLAILALINFVNFADRTVVLPLYELLKLDFNVSDTQLGWLQAVLQIVLSVATIPLALMADRWNRARIIAAGVMVWSIATFASGAAQTFGALLVARAFVGVGEAAYGPAAQSMISGAFSVAARARAQSVFAAGMLLGGAAGQAIGGIIGDRAGWAPAFFVVGIPGMLLGLSALHLEEPSRGPRYEVVPLLRLLRVPAFLALNLCGVLLTFAALSFITWGPTFAEREKGFSLSAAGVWLGSLGALALVSGVLVGGYVADALQKRLHYGRIVCIVAAMLAAAPFLFWAIYSEDKRAVLAGLFIAVFFLSWYHGPVTAVIHDMMPRRAHATSVGVYMFVTQLVGGTVGPLVTGRVSDLHDLSAGLKVATGVLVLGALCFLLVIYFIHRDGLRHASLEMYHAEG